MKKVKQQNYIDSEKLHDLLEQWKEDKKQNKQMSKELAIMFQKITEGVITKASYNQYEKETKEDMMSGALLNLVLYIHNYKTENSKSKNAAFTYVTFAVETSFKSYLTKIKVKKEKEQNYIDRMLEDDGFFFDD